MLKKRNRLNSKEFEEVFQKGRKEFSRNFLFVKMGGKEEGKVSVAVSKKVYRKAVERARARRIVYRILKDNFENFLTKKKFYGIILITKDIFFLDGGKIKKEINNLLK